MADTIVEVHVPLTRSLDITEDDPPFPFIDTISDFLDDLDDSDNYEGATAVDDAEESEGHYIFFLGGASESALLRVATTISQLPTVPTGAFAMVTDSDAATFGLGTRVDLGELSPDRG